MLRIAIGNVFLCSILAFGLAHPTAPTTYENLNAVLWMQTAVEYKAATVQTYRVAQAALLQGLRDPHWTAALKHNGDFGNLHPAVLLDVAETVLAISPFDARSCKGALSPARIVASFISGTNLTAGRSLMAGRSKFEASQVAISSSMSSAGRATSVRA
jgi:hypothetical protein